jgi:TorA maturation chaperone TorD/DNA-binding transcriptional regulator YdaS (Cro superfamily)
MRDEGLQEAIRAVGGVSELARRLGISQPSVSNWDRIPVERVLSVEAATGISRAVLRPDLFESRSAPGVDDVDAARGREYALLATLLGRAPDADFLSRVAQLRGDPSPLGLAHAALGEAAARVDAERVGREYFELFVGLGRGELLPYGSYYMSGFLYERPLARLRGDLKRFGIEQAPSESEPEDHAAILCEVMAALAGGEIEAPPEAEREIFQKHIAPWMGQFFSDLENSRTAKFYARVGLLGRTLMEIETEAFALP